MCAMTESDGSELASACVVSLIVEKGRKLLDRGLGSSGAVCRGEEGPSVLKRYIEHGTSTAHHLEL